MDLIEVKIIAMSLLGIISLLLGILPLKLGSFIDSDDYEGKRNFWKRTITSVLLCFGGGVLLGTSFIHILPDVSSFLLAIEDLYFDSNTDPLKGRQEIQAYSL